MDEVQRRRIQDIIAKPIGPPLEVTYDGKQATAHMVSVVESYTVDDLLVWLRDRVGVVDITADAHLHVRYFDADGAMWEGGGAPTLIAALEAAVRAVSETLSPSTKD